MPNGKGDTPRPLSVTQEEFARRWNRIFRERFCTLCGASFTNTHAPDGFDICEDCWNKQLDLEDYGICPFCGDYSAELNLDDNEYQCQSCGWQQQKRYL